MPDAKVVAMPVQLIGVPQGVVLKRGIEEMLVAGDNALDAVSSVLAHAGSSPGGVTPDEILTLFQGRWPGLDIAGLIAQFRARNILVDAEIQRTYPEGPEQVLAWNLGANPSSADASLAEVSINVLGVNLVSRRLVEALTSVGARVRVIDHPRFRNVRLFGDSAESLRESWVTTDVEPFAAWDGSLPADLPVCLVACSDFGGSQTVAEWNAFAFAHGWDFLPVLLQNLLGLVGPFVVPGETACFQCLLLREDANAPPLANRRAVELFAFEGQSVAAYHPSMASMLGDLAALELMKHYAYGWPSSAIGNVIEVNPLGATMRPRPILKAPGCPVCSTLNLRGPLQLLEQGAGPP